MTTNFHTNSFKEKRKYKRYNIMNLVFTDDGVPIGYTIDMSEGGMRIILFKDKIEELSDQEFTSFTIKPGDIVRLEQISIDGKKVWSKELNDKKTIELGFKFNDDKNILIHIKKIISYFTEENDE